MPRVGFESAIPVFKRAKTVYALGRVATVIGTLLNRSPLNVKTHLCSKCYDIHMFRGMLVDKHSLQ
jgi:hypothetical protein